MAMDYFQHTHLLRIKEWIANKKKKKKCQENIKFLDVEDIGFVTGEKVYGRERFRG